MGRPAWSVRTADGGQAQVKSLTALKVTCCAEWQCRHGELSSSRSEGRDTMDAKAKQKEVKIKAAGRP